MPAIKSGDFVLVTGASGYLAAHTVEAFLDKGYPVRGTVRSKDKGEYLVNLFKNKKAKFEYVIVKDIAEEGSFDEAVKDVDAIAHTASPFHFQADDPQELFAPAVQGTVGVLKSAKKNNPNVKRVVITSSVAAIMNSETPLPHTFTEADWNPVSIPACEKQGRNASGPDKYRASKTLAEQAFWKFLKEESPSFDGATINPPVIIGPLIHQCDTVEGLNTSAAIFYDWQSGKKTEKDLPGPNGNYVDVRDVALAHVRALEVEEAGGERFITGAGPVSGNDYCVGINKAFPDRKNVAKGDASKRQSINANSIVFDGAKATKVLGIKYTDIDTTTYDTAKSLAERFDK